MKVRITKVRMYLKEYDRFKEQILQRSPDDSNYIQIKNAVRDIICNNLEDIYNNITELDNISYFTQVTESNAEYMNRIGINKDDLKMLFIEEYIRTRL